jgi:hypothetical protein
MSTYSNILKPIVFLTFLYNINYCTAQTEKIKISEIISSIHLSQNCSYLVTGDEKIYLFTEQDKKVQPLINFDSYNSHGVEIIYDTNKKSILRKLKKVESAIVLSIEVVSQNKDELILKVDLSKTNYQLYRKNKFTITLIDSWLDINYNLKSDKWTVTKITCEGF